MSDLSIGFEQAVSGLLKLKPKKTVDVFSRLEVLKTASVSLQIIKEIDELKLEDFEPIKESDLDDFDCNIIDEALRLIYEQAPYETEMVDFLVESYLIPESLGYPVSWDHFFDICTSPGEYAVYEVFLFFSCLRLSEDDSFNRASHEFGWGVEFPEIFLRKEIYLDSDLFVEKLRAAGLEDFITAIDVYQYTSGNAYFDINLYDEVWLEDFDLPEFSVDGYKALVTEWEEAQVINDTVLRAEAHFRSDRKAVANLLIEIFVSSLKTISEKPKKTLIEIFSEDEDLEEGE